VSAFFDEIHARYRDPAAFVRMVRSKMQLHGITQGAVAARSGFGAAEVSRWIGSKSRVPTMATMLILDEAVERIIEEK
jgi:transcriptional regulator with XRE-family HTH domain